MIAPPEIARLVERFERSRDAFLSGEYNETQLRREFLDPFFTALGWDVDNKQGFAEAYKDVIHEDAIKIGTATKAPDYSFRVGGVRKFFVEAKKPSVNVKEDISPAYQLRRYAWSAKLPLSILTDFEEFAVYDCRVRPFPTDKSSTNRTMYLRYPDYENKWEEIAGVFSKDAVLKGSFDKHAEATKAKRGTTEVDDAFLHEIEEWRKMLAANIALRNANLSQRELNFAVQRTIDRIIFLRICEDRGIETYGSLMALQNGEHTYKRLVAVFHRADERYNSGLFHFRPEKGRNDLPDEMTLGLEIDDKPLKDILKSLYYPHSPYEFSVLPADILGQVYEQFLGKVIRLTSGHRAVVEDKPEVKKAGGVYYTPTYIVEYIVKNTVGRLLSTDLTPVPSPGWRGVSGGRPARPLSGGGEVRKPSTTPKQAATLRILDPACGSGSFLIGAYQYLLDWHRDWYVDNGPEKYTTGRNPTLYQVALPDEAGGHWRLTTTERKRILLNNIYGVDIDPQAVETTKLSLLLKVLEGENEQTISRQLRMFHERALPDLSSNIKCGNSLIGSDFYDGQLSLMDDNERMRINAFDWKKEFKEIMDAGGFGAVIGNPPYGMLQPHNTEEQYLQYLRGHYVAAEFKIEMFHLFIQRGVALLNPLGQFGYIVPATLLNNVYAEGLRRWVADNSAIRMLSVAREKVFENADVHPMVVILKKEGDRHKRVHNEVSTSWGLDRFSWNASLDYSRVAQTRFSRLPGGVWNILVNEENGHLIEKLSNQFEKLADLSKINRGLITGDRDRYFSEQKKSKSHIPILAGSDVQRYFAKSPSEYVLFDRPESAGGSWDPEVHLAPHKVVVRQIGYKPMAAILQNPIAVTGNLFTVRGDSLEIELYLLGLINSGLVSFFWRIMFTDFKASFPQVTIFSLSQLPIRTINFSDPADKARHDRMVQLVEQMLALHKQLATAKTDHEKTSTQRQIDSTDKQIDELVYELYGITEAERGIVEGENRKGE